MRELTDKWIDRFLEADDPDAPDVFLYPEPEFNLAYMKGRMQLALHRAVLDGVPEGNARLVRQFIGLCDKMMAPPPMPAQPGMQALRRCLARCRPDRRHRTSPRCRQGRCRRWPDHNSQSWGCTEMPIQSRQPMKPPIRPAAPAPAPLPATPTSPCRCTAAHSKRGWQEQANATLAAAKARLAVLQPEVERLQRVIAALS